VIASDPAVYSIFLGKPAEEIMAANRRLTMSVITGAGHSPHRDKPAETIAELRRVLAD
jgi:pimeloyl-ACP methyl ester carboxylesterase